MRYVGPYSHASTPTYLSLANASTPDRRPGLLTLADQVTAACAPHLAVFPSVHALQPAVLTDVQKETLIDGYENRSAKVKRLLEAMRISLPAEHLDLCPFCNLETTYQIDHYLPKRRYPEFSLHGPNLLPICPGCNQAKGSAVATAAGHRIILMPTADAALTQRVLTATLFMNPGPHFAYSIDQNATVNPADHALICRHFDRLNLAVRYRRRAHSLMEALKNNVSRVSSLQTVAQKRRIARRTILDGYRAAKMEEPTNGWRLAFYRAILAQRIAFTDWLDS